MAQLTPLPINPPPGVVITETDRVAEGRFILPFDKVRFVKGRPQKDGGNVRVTQTAMSGTPRALHCWRDFLQNQYVASGTYRKLYAFDSGFILTDITPIQASGTLGTNPFTTTNGSTSVTVNHTGHGRGVGDTVIFSGATTFNNVTMNGTFLVQTVITANAYTLTALTTANASGSGGGAAVAFQYEISVGTELGAFGSGWGVGQWGLGTWGTARATSTIFIEPRVWSLDHFGVVLLATYNGGTLWAFDPTQAEPWPRAVGTLGGVSMGAPSDFRAMFITPERFVVGCCDAMVLKVCSQNDPTTWTPATANTAFQRTLQEGTKLVGGGVLAPFVSLVWSDAALFLLQYTGSQFVYNSSLVGKDCGLIGPKAFVTVDGVAYWQGADNFYMYNGTVMPIPNVEDIRKFFFDALPVTLGYQCWCEYVPKYHELRFYQPTIGATNPTNFVIYSINDQCWAPGTGLYDDGNGNKIVGRASGHHFTQGDTSPILAGTDGFLYNHDPIGDTFNDNGTVLTATLTFSPWALKEGDQGFDIEGVVWDFFEQTGDITATINGFDRLTDLAPMDSDTVVVPQSGAGISDYRVSGRYLGFSLTSAELAGYFRLGKPAVFARPQWRRR